MNTSFIASSKHQQSFISTNRELSGSEKLFFAELRSKDKEAERIFEVECRKQESTNQVAGQNTVIDLGFYFICTLGNQ